MEYLNLLDINEELYEFLQYDVRNSKEYRVPYRVYASGRIYYFNKYDTDSIFASYQRTYWSIVEISS